MFFLAWEEKVPVLMSFPSFPFKTEFVFFLLGSSLAAIFLILVVRTHNCRNNNGPLLLALTWLIWIRQAIRTLKTWESNILLPRSPVLLLTILLCRRGLKTDSCPSWWQGKESLLTKMRDSQLMSFPVLSFSRNTLTGFCFTFTFVKFCIVPSIVILFFLIQNFMMWRKCAKFLRLDRFEQFH